MVITLNTATKKIKHSISSSVVGIFYKFVII